MKRWRTASWLVAGLLTVAAALAGGGVRAAGPLAIEVTSSGDPAGNTGICPDAARCTLRKAIELANGDGQPDPFVITFKAAAFPASTPVTIALTAPLPEATRVRLTIDATARGVVVDGSALSGNTDGLVIAGADSLVRGLRLQHFKGACLAVSGPNSTIGGDADLGQGLRLGNCDTALVITGAGSTVRGATIGVAATNEEAAPVETGIRVATSGAVVGGEEIAAAAGNVIGNAKTAIVIGVGAPPDITNIVVARNAIGRTRADAAAEVGVGVLVRQRSRGVRVVKNTISTAVTAGIQVAADAGGVAVARVTVQGNSFAGITGMAIDLGGDGMRNPNDTGDMDTGPNGLLNYPLIGRATQQRVEGAAGPNCGGCKVELYAAVHTPGGAADYGGSPVGSATADSSGTFVVEGPPVTPGQWVTALVTDADGNTSEFGPSTRVGAGIIQCGNTALGPGWTLAGYFGEASAIGATVPGDPGGRIRAVYHRRKGTGDYDRWLRDTPAGRTLMALEPGEAYWFLADDAVTLPAGFSLTMPLPLPLKEGWNDVVYFGATADVRDALSSVDGKFREVYRYRNAAPEGWEIWGEVVTPAWARQFSDMRGCETYVVRMSVDGTLTPLQP